MGLFDYVKIEYPLPVSEQQYWEWQTKDTDAQFMDTYRVTMEGRLVHETYRLEETPADKLPYPDLPFIGALTRIPLGDVDTEYHGDLYMIGSPPGAWTGRYAEYRLRFTHGTLESITPLENKPC